MNFYEVISTLLVPRYATHIRPLPVPTNRWDECPSVCLEISSDWAGYLIGLLEALDQPDAWRAEGEELRDVREQVKSIMVALMEDNNMSCCCAEPNKRRYTSDGTLEVSFDGGITWQDGSQYDPRATTPLLPPITPHEGNTAKCEAAQNVASHVHAAADQIIADLGTGVAIGGLIAAIFALLFFLEVLTLGAISPLLIGLAAALLQVGDTAFGAAMTEAVYYDFQCIIFCHMDEDGRLAPNAIGQLLSDIDEQFTGIAHTFLSEWVKINGEIGINNMGATDDGVEGDDCEDCLCGSDCEAIWIKGNVDGNTALGTVVNLGGGLYEVTSELYGDGVNYASMLTTDETKCCAVLSIEAVPGYSLPATGTAAARIVCPNTQHVGNISEGNLLTESNNFNYIAWNSGNAFKIHIQFG